MAENTEPVSLSGTTIAISATLPDTHDAAGFSSTDIVYTNIGFCENHGNHGGTAAVAEFTDVSDGTIYKIKGPKNYGTKSIMLAHIPTDAGQLLIESAFESNNHYSIKQTYPSGRIHYFKALITKSENQDGATGDPQKVAVDFAITKKIIKVAAA